MFDIGASELLMVVIVAIVVIGPKDMPMALRAAGRWIGKMRRVSAHFRTGIDAMVREAELEEMERQWREQNEAIMKGAPAFPTAEEMAPISASDLAVPSAGSAESGAEAAPDNAQPTQPQLPLP